MFTCLKNDVSLGLSKIVAILLFLITNIFVLVNDFHATSIVLRPVSLTRPEHHVKRNVCQSP